MGKPGACLKRRQAMYGIFRGKIQGATTVGERGQVVIPSELRTAFRIKAGEKLIVIANDERKIIGLMRADDFNKFLKQVSKVVSRLEKKVTRKSR
jgi:AbrB family looped-hinge helix DNA binding protein